MSNVRLNTRCNINNFCIYQTSFGQFRELKQNVPVQFKLVHDKIGFLWRAVIRSMEKRIVYEKYR